IYIYDFQLPKNKIKFIIKSWDNNGGEILDNITYALLSTLGYIIDRASGHDVKINIDISGIQHNEISFTVEYFTLLFNFLPIELLTIIASYLDNTDIGSLEDVSTNMNKIIERSFQMSRYL